MRKILAVACLLGTLPTALAAQNTGASPPAASSQAASDAERIRVRVDLHNILMTVTDKKGHLVLDLTKDDFRVFEDQQPQTIRFFSRETNLPLRIGLLIDTSNSIRDRLRFEQEAAIDFLNAALRPGRDSAYVLAFDVEPQLVQDYTDNMEKLSEAIRGLQAGGVTSLYDAIYFACKQKMLIFPPPEPYLRRVMIVVSDGQDNQSEHTREEALGMAQRAEVTIYAISTNRTGTPSRGDKVLRRLAEETGGHAFFPFEATELEESFQQIARELRSQYSIAYISTNKAHDGSFRNVSIQPLDKALHVRANAGYFAPSQ